MEVNDTSSYKDVEPLDNKNKSSKKQKTRKWVNGNKKFKQFGVVLKKELKDAFRDKKSIFATFILPLLLFPIFFLIIGTSANSVTEKAINPKLTLVQNGVSVAEDSALSTYFYENVFSLNPNLNVEYVECEDFKQGLIDSEIYVAVVVPENFFECIADVSATINLAVIYDDRTTSGSTTASSINDVLNLFSDTILSGRVGADVDLTPVKSNVISLSDAYTDVTRYGTDSPILHLLVPILLTLLISIGGASIATDLIAGEKERNTFESLLSTSASRFSILSAKYAVIIIFSFLSAIVEVISLILSMLLTKDSLGSSLTSIALPVDGVVLVILNLLMLAGLFSSLLLLLTASSNTLKEAQSKSTLVMFLPMIIAYATMYLDCSDVAMWTMSLPIYNVVVSIKMLLAGVMNNAYLWGSLAINICYAVASVFVTMKTFSRESLITK